MLLKVIAGLDLSINKILSWIPRSNRTITINELIYRDPVTNINNRNKLLKDILETRLNSFENQQLPPRERYFIINPRSFAAINDTFDHAVGDSLLIRTAEIIDSTINKFCQENNLSRQAHSIEVYRVEGVNFIVRGQALSIQTSKKLTKAIEQALAKASYPVDFKNKIIDLQSTSAYKKDGTPVSGRSCNVGLLSIDSKEIFDANKVMDILRNSLNQVNKENSSFIETPDLGGLHKQEVIENLNIKTALKNIQDKLTETEIIKTREQNNFINNNNHFFALTQKQGESSAQRHIRFAQSLKFLREVLTTTNRGTLFDNIKAFVNANIPVESVEITDIPKDAPMPEKEIGFNDKTFTITIPLFASNGTQLKTLGLIKVTPQLYAAIKNDLTILDPIRITVEQALNLYQDYALIDHMTLLANSQAFSIHLQNLCKTQTLRSIGFFDIDKFSGFTQSFGSEVGDHILKTLGNVINDICRKPEYSGKITVYRWGGEEFYRLQKGDKNDPALIKKFTAEINQAIEILTTQNIYNKVTEDTDYQLDIRYKLTWSNIEKNLKDTLGKPTDLSKKEKDYIYQSIQTRFKELALESSNAGKPFDVNTEYLINPLQLKRFVQKIGWSIDKLSISTDSIEDINSLDPLKISALAAEKGEAAKLKHDQKLKEQISKEKNELK